MPPLSALSDLRESDLGIDHLGKGAETWRPYRAYAAIMLWETL